MIPDLRSYDAIVVSSSAGKDSQAMLDVVCARATAAAALDRVVVVHCDLGRVEWPGTRELAERQAARYGVRFEVVRREQGDLLDQVEARGLWPSPRQRYCTSDQKRGPVHRLFTRLAREQTTGGPARILSCMGHRAEESTFRARREPLTLDERASNGRRTVEVWLPLHDWPVERVWNHIHYSSATPDLIHPAYALGMPRLSCCFCIFAPKAALVLAGRHNPELLDEYVRVEEATAHRFRVDLSMAEVRDEVRAGVTTTNVPDWRM